jgi:hypothetical protein
MDLPKNPFKSADRFIVLRDKCQPRTWIAQIQLLSDMIIMPLITLFLLFIGKNDIFMALGTLNAAYRAWSEWIEYTELWFAMERMKIRMAQVRGPFIATNDAKYMPYVWADAVVRSNNPR